MAQPHYIVDYLGAMSVEAGEVYTSDSVLASYPTADMLKMKSEGVKVSIDGTDAFPISYDDESYITTGKTYIFSKPCIIAVGKYISIT